MTLDLNPTGFDASAFGSGPYALEGSGGTSEVVFEVGNSDTKIFGAPAQLQQLIHAYASYPTPMQHDPNSNWRAPDAGEANAWDGWIRLAKFNNRTGEGAIPTGLLDLCLWICQRWNFHLAVRDSRVRPLQDTPASFVPLVDRDYQLEAVAAFLEHGQGVLDMPPRSGKTRTAAEIYRCLHLPMIWIAPKSNIVTRTHETFEDLIGKNSSMILKGTNKKDVERAMHARAVITTYATAVKLSQEFYDTRHFLVFDELHHAASKTAHTISRLACNIFYRLGMTGTFGRSGDDAIAMHAFLSKVLIKVEASTLVAAGYLVPADVVVLPMECPKLKAVKAGYSVGAGPYGIWRHEYRNLLIVWVAHHLFQCGRKILILVATKEQGNLILEGLREHFPTQSGKKYQRVEFVSTNRPAPVNDAVIEAYNETEAIQILIGTSLVSEGTDLPRCDALVNAMGRKAEIELVQAAYRVCTACEGKPARSIIVDFVDSHNDQLHRHAKDRVQHYFEQDTFDVQVLENVADFLNVPL